MPHQYQDCALFRASSKLSADIIFHHLIVCIVIEYKRALVRIMQQLADKSPEYLLVSLWLAYIRSRQSASFSYGGMIRSGASNPECRAMLNTIPRGGRLPPSLTAIGIALAPAALVLILSLVPAFFASVEEKPKASIIDCREINEPAGRLACFDALAKEQLAVPAKGGLAVISPDGQR